MKEEIIGQLKLNQNHFMSGEQLSERLGISRAAVWKWIKQLKEEGYKIESQTKLGYRLIESPETLFSYEIKPLLTTNVIGKKILYYESLDSTNNEAKNLADSSFDEGTVIIADEQTKGRGRLGRNWTSPKGKGVWLTIMLKPQIEISDAYKMTIIAALSVYRAIRSECGVETKIKWPNDIVLNGKKVCGILTEMNAEIDNIHYLIVGIGVNANLEKEDFDEELLDKATSIKLEIGMNVNRKSFTASILNEFEKIYMDYIAGLQPSSIIDEYREMSATIGKEVRLIDKNNEKIGLAKDINDAGQLIVELKDGSLLEISSGEVSVRGLYGYI